MKKIKIFSIGGATFDMFIRTDDQAIIKSRTPAESREWLCMPYGGKVNIRDVRETYGGGGTNTSVGFSRMGLDAGFIGKIGESYGDKVIRNLEKEGVNTAYVKKTKKDKTAFSTILNSFEGDRTILVYAGANRFLTEKDIPVSDLKETDWIFLNHLSAENSKITDIILRILKENPNIKFAWNPGNEQIEQGVKKWKSLLARTDILFLNKEEASKFSKISYRLAGIKHEDPNRHIHMPRNFLPPYADDCSEIMYKFLQAGVKNVVITDGKNGAQATDGKRIYFCPVIRHKYIDSTGAGDAYGCGFTSAIANKESIKTAMLYGALNANSVINYFGAQEGLLSREEIIKRIKKLDICVTSTKIK